MKIKLNSIYQRFELEQAVNRMHPLCASTIKIGATVAEIPAHEVVDVLAALEANRQECLARPGSQRGRLNAIGSVRRHIEKASQPHD